MNHITSHLITPECSVPGCHRSGDHHTMVKCRGCGRWYCESHVASAASELNLRGAAVPTIKLIETGAQGLSYYLGYCAACLTPPAERPANNSSWLR